MTDAPFPRDPEVPGPAPGTPGQDPGPAPDRQPARPAYTPGSAQPRLNRPVHERYPQIRPTSGYGDPRVRHTGPGPGAGTEQEPERSSKLNARLVLALSVVVGQLWGLTIVVDEWMAGDTGTAWWGAGFLVLSFLVVLGLWALDPKDR
ncbi:hypothetical protein M5362_24285 [Streptomyces sp. Je 1-79]|uniref:hypothetical protein n=1 Tax=Streptomyces sp. Je 1-79 TaxID=2943847 RepID=UPI0021A2CBAB|nr:hypothetical protein [Streptomyces sp. Je 1-79]MCT4356256.1 hypothetical protein [Streptomyces sp. Je 1-79]